MTRAELQTEAESLASVLGRTVEPGLSRSKLEALIAELKAETPTLKATEEEPKAAPVVGEVPAETLEWLKSADPAPEPKAFKPPPAKALVDGAAVPPGGPPKKSTKREPPKVPHYVAPGRATQVGTKIATGYTPVKASDFVDGQAALDDLVRRGIVIKTGL